MAIERILDIVSTPAQDAAVRAEIAARPEFSRLADIGEIKPDARLDPAEIEVGIAKRQAKAFEEVVAENARRTAAFDKAYRDTALDGLTGCIGILAHAIDEEEPTAALAVHVDPDGKVDISAEGTAVAEFIADVDAALERDIAHGVPESSEVFIVGHNERVTDHAVARYLERVKGFDPATVRETMASAEPVAAIARARTHIWTTCLPAIEMGVRSRRAEGVKFELAVVSVVPDGGMPSRVREGGMLERSRA